MYRRRGEPVEQGQDEVTQLIPQERTTEHITKHRRSPDFAKCSAVTVVDTTVAKTEARPLEIAKHMAAGETRLTKSVIEAWPPGIEKRSATTADATAVDTTVAKSVSDARPLRIVEHSAKYMATTKSVLAEPPGKFQDEDGMKLGLLRSQRIVPCKILDV